MGPLVARVLKLLLHFHLVFTTGITFSFVVKVKSQDHVLVVSIGPSDGEANSFHLLCLTCLLLIIVSHLQKLIPVSENDFVLKFLEVKFGLNTTT